MKLGGLMWYGPGRIHKLLVLQYLGKNGQMKDFF